MLVIFLICVVVCNLEVEAFQATCYMEFCELGRIFLPNWIFYPIELGKFTQ